LKSPKDVLALGQAIVRELELDDRGTVLERWLAHHLAELIAEADRADGPAKAAAEQRAVDVILKLWAHRRALPEKADPLGGYRDAIAVLSRLIPEADPWKRFQRHGTYDELLHEMFETLCRIVLGGIVLTQITRPRPVSEVEARALEDEEIFLQKVLEQWLPFFEFPPKPPKVVVKYVGLDASDDEKTHEAHPDTACSDSEPEQQEPSSESNIHSAIVTQLKGMQAELDNLLTRWTKVAPDKRNKDGDKTRDLESEE